MLKKMKSTEEATEMATASGGIKKYTHAHSQTYIYTYNRSMHRKNGAQSSAEVYKCFSGIHLTLCRNVHFGQGFVNN